MRRIPALLTCALLSALPAAANEGDWRAFRDGTVALMRHGGAISAEAGAASAPSPVATGGCDPRARLTELGGEDMRRLGVRLREAGVAPARILASRECSAWETAALLGLGPAIHAEALDPPGPAERDARRAALQRVVVAAASGEGPVLLITHRINIALLTGLDIAPGEILLLRPTPAGLALAGRIVAD
ncbi:histidine phosphatase family protein [Falsiroseomonas oryzae]|uniref:hypothetical protein n=1 Tax=Falsiroseomonas oryzae TaxID=2766473 RepID=UPI0022EAA821|nr:hypothetical protein [Roseomonas sp. MO-31]